MAILRIIKENIVPTLNKDKALSILECQVLYMLLKKQKINLPSLIIGHMNASKYRRHLPYGLILTHIFHHFKLIGTPQRNFAILLDEKAMSHQKVYLWQGNYLSAAEFKELSLEDQNEYRRQHKMPTLTSEGAPILKRQRTTQEGGSAPSPDIVHEIVSQLKYYMKHKLIQPLKKQISQLARNLKGVEDKVDILKLQMEKIQAERAPSAEPSHGGGASSFRPPSPNKGKGIALDSSSSEESWHPLLSTSLSGGIHIQEPTNIDSDSESSSSSRTQTQT